MPEVCENCGGPVIPRQCPHCGALTDGHTAVDGSDSCPSPGDTSICLYCSGISIFTEDTLRKTTDEEWRQIMGDEDTQRGLAVIAAMRAAGEVPPC